MNGISAATVASFTAAVYFALAIGARAVRWSPVPPHRLMPVVALVAYVVIAFAATRRAALGRRIAGVVTLVVLHAALVGGTAWVWTLGTRSTFDATLTDALWALPSVVILQALCAPIVWWPLRAFFARPRPVRRVRPRGRRGPAPLPRAQAVAWPGSTPVPDGAEADEATTHEPEETRTAMAAHPGSGEAHVVPHGASASSSRPSFADADGTDEDIDMSRLGTAPAAGRRDHPRDEEERVEAAVSEPPSRQASSAPSAAVADEPRRDAGSKPRAAASVATPETPTPAVDTRSARASGERLPGADAPGQAPAYAPLDASTPAIRISFTALAAQIPPDVLTASAAKIGATLPQPGYVLVPEALVVNQLGEGLVRIAWDVIARQLPDAAFAGSRAAVARRLADVAIELPLAEIVSQVSAELFSDGLEPVDVTSIEGFPMPFLPAGDAETEDGIETEAVAARDDAEPDVDESEPEVFEDAGTVEMADADVEIAVEVPATEAVARDDEALDDGDDELADGVADDVDEEPVTVAAPFPEADVVRHAIEAVPAPVPVTVTAVAPREIRTLFARLNRFDIETERVDDVTHYRVVGADVSVEALRQVAAHLVDPLGAGWAGRGVDQITIRSATRAVVLTALGDLRGTGAILVAGARRGPGLALLELIGRRGVAEWAERAPAHARADIVQDDAFVEPIDGEDLARIASVMDAFGTVAGRRFAGDAALVYAFVGPALEAADVAEFAREVVDAITAADVAELTPFESVTARRGAEQLVIRAVARPRGVPRLVVAAGTVARPGLAQRQVERAAALLAAEAD